MTSVPTGQSGRDASNVGGSAGEPSVRSSRKMNPAIRAPSVSVRGRTAPREPIAREESEQRVSPIATVEVPLPAAGQVRRLPHRPEALLPASVFGSYLPPYADEAPSRFCLPVQMLGGVFGLQTW